MTYQQLIDNEYIEHIFQNKISSPVYGRSSCCSCCISIHILKTKKERNFIKIIQLLFCDKCQQKEISFIPCFEADTNCWKKNIEVKTPKRIFTKSIVIHFFKLMELNVFQLSLILWYCICLLYFFSCVQIAQKICSQSVKQTKTNKQQIKWYKTNGTLIKHKFALFN